MGSKGGLEGVCRGSRGDMQGVCRGYGGVCLEGYAAGLQGLCCGAAATGWTTPSETCSVESRGGERRGAGGGAGTGAGRKVGAPPPSVVEGGQRVRGIFLLV